MSSPCFVNCGVPQGSNLGPLLFILFINDISQAVKHSTVSLYADDTCLYYAADNSTDLSTCMNEDLNRISKWLSCNELLLNTDKCEFMVFGSRHKLLSFVNVQVNINGVQVKRVEECKYLGVTLTPSLNWNPHIMSVKRKATSSLYCLKRIRPFISQETALLLFKTLFQPHFEYCSLIWFNAGISLVKQLNVLQNRALRVVLHVDSRFSSHLLYSFLDIDRIDIRWRKQALCYIFKLIHGLQPLSLCSFISVKRSNYHFRNFENKLVLPKPKTNFMRNGTLYNSIKLFNDLPSNIRSKADIEAFTQAVDVYHKI